jgi:hypothetical protein
VLAAVAHVNVRIEAPAHLPGGCVQSNSVLPHAAQVQQITNLQRRDLESAFNRVTRARRLASVKGPREAQSAYRGRCDVRQRRVALAIPSSTIGRPVVARSARGLDRIGAVLRRSR